MDALNRIKGGGVSVNMYCRSENLTSAFFSESYVLFPFSSDGKTYIWSTFILVDVDMDLIFFTEIKIIKNIMDILDITFIDDIMNIISRHHHNHPSKYGHHRYHGQEVHVKIAVPKSIAKIVIDPQLWLQFLLGMIRNLSAGVMS